MKWKPLFAVLLGLLIVGVTSGSAAATVWGVPAGSATGSTGGGINPHIQVSGSYDGVTVSFSVSWNDHNGAAWGVYQYGVYDDTIHKYIIFSHGSRRAVKGYTTPIIPITTVTYSVDITLSYTHASPSAWGGYNVVTHYHVIVKKTVSHPFTGSSTKTIVDVHKTLQGYVPSPKLLQSINVIGKKN